ncbi:ECF-type sigma factor [Synechococcus sp. Cruz CV-v-12]|uniref:ECF-type sigma factor n=1 Tax=Synechococcus sp. Cruz CV-v-12 TaxID=2823728 RepID=UPI0020CDCF07|nr:ECF-type sigma factor [Synechococcus sp. Cruz CV-v-12]MCP9874374.1 hypothetical protein [Synechococcus sp. Cruz CV-v-12]
MPDQGLHNLLSAARAGESDSDAAAFGELLRLVRLLVRSGMGRRLRDFRESADVCQSIARSFVADHRSGAIAFQSEQQLVAYLRTVVASKLASLARSDQAVKRGGPHPHVRTASLRDADHLADAGAASHGADPLTHVVNAELSDQADAILTDDDRELARLRLRGMDWSQIAEHLHQDSQVLRKRWSRLMARLGDGGVAPTGPGH